MVWSENNLMGDAAYTRVVNEGFISTEGYEYFGFGDQEKHGLGGKITLPLINFLKVNPEYPMEVGELGEISIRPVGDKRWPAEIWRDFEVYNNASFLMVPYDVNEKDLGAWKKLTIFEKGFEDVDKKESSLSILYADKGLPADNRRIHTWSMITPPQVLRTLFNWLYSGKKFSYLDKNWPGMDEPWHHVGRATVSPKEIREFVNKVGLMLEERFGERLFCEKPREKI